jgi:hypothetical protein
MSMKAEQIVNAMLEADFDAHVKQHDRIQKFDKAIGSYKNLAGLKSQAQVVFNELGQALSFERALAYKGLNREDVERYIYGGQLGATDNYKGTVPAKVCRNQHCELRSLWGEGHVYPQGMRAAYQPMETEVCRGCDGPLETTARKIPPSDLRGKFAQHIVGVELKDGRKVWFDDLIPPRHHNWGGG